MEHQKHTKLVKSNRGFFSKNEISLLGTNCNEIKKAAKGLADFLKNSWDIIYVDADHLNSNEKINSISSFSGVFTDKINFSEFHLFKFNHKTLKNSFYDTASLTIVNGNHNKAKKQIVIIDSSKESSLKKRREDLTDVIALIAENSNYPKYIRECIPNCDDIPFFSFNNYKGLSLLIDNLLKNNIPPIQGLILAGGYSSRMGNDKFKLVYHGKPQHEHLLELLNPFCEYVTVSCREEQSENIQNPIIDKFIGLGPMGGILTAFQSNPNVAWLTVACDIPLLDFNSIEILVNSRNPNKLATCYYNSKTNFPEPLITIWEPKAYPILLEYMSQGYSCPRKVLINNDIEMVHLENESILMNVNKKEEMKSAVDYISKNQ
tara:strand:+ start:48 stop:1175 length:1128 start_codon:yes stop_codon:yes gene_type:complete